MYKVWDTRIDITKTEIVTIPPLLSFKIVDHILSMYKQRQYLQNMTTQEVGTNVVNTFDCLNNKVVGL
jgi:hypothetical protein